MKRGTLTAIWGGAGSGKTTQALTYAKALSGMTLVVNNEDMPHVLFQKGNLANMDKLHMMCYPSAHPDLDEVMSNVSKYLDNYDNFVFDLNFTYFVPVDMEHWMQELVNQKGKTVIFTGHSRIPR